MEAFSLSEKMQLIFVWLTFTFSFCKATVKDAVKQMTWFLACSFFKYYIWICCKKLWLNVIFVQLLRFSSFLFLLILINFVGMDFKILSSFFKVVGLSAFADENFLQNMQKMWSYVANHRNIFRVYDEDF